MGYDYGDLVRVSGHFTDANGDDVDPTVVMLTFVEPGVAAVTYTFGVDADLVRDSAGHYHVDLDADTAGRWRYRWFSTGTGQAAGETFFDVRKLGVS